MWDEYKCNKCKKKIDSHQDIWNDGLCDKCKTTRRQNIILTLTILGIFGLLIGGFLGVVEYNYSIQKCDNLKSTQSNYDFDFKVETNANYNSNCYYLINHPFAFLSYLITGFIFGVAGVVLPGIIIAMVLSMRRN